MEAAETAMLGEALAAGRYFGPGCHPLLLFLLGDSLGGRGLNEKREDRVRVGAVWGGQAWLSPLYQEMSLSLISISVPSPLPSLLPSLSA